MIVKPVALVTGSAIRIGKEISKTLYAHGFSLALHYDKSKKEVNELKLALPDSCLFQADLSKEESYLNLMQSVFEFFGRIDCFVYNASIFKNDNIFSSSRLIWDEHMEVNLRAPFVLSQKFAKINYENNNDTNIIFILDQKVLNLTKHYLTYTLSKSALWTLTQTLAQSLCPNIRVNAVGPGPVIKNMYQTDEMFKRQLDKTLLKKRVDKEDIAKTVLFLLNNKSITGQIIAVDSGQHLYR